jgi:hypothetical protein
MKLDFYSIIHTINIDKVIISIIGKELYQDEKDIVVHFQIDNAKIEILDVGYYHI